MPSVSGPRVHSEYSFCSAATGCTAWARRTVCGAGLRQAEMPDLACRDQVLDRAGHVLDRHVGIDAVLIEQVDHLDPEPLQRGLATARICSGRLFRPAMLAVRIDVEAELGGDHDLVADGPSASPTISSLVKGP